MIETKFCKFCETPIEDPTADVCCNELRLFNENRQLKLKLRIARKKLAMHKANTFKSMTLDLLRNSLTELSSKPTTSMDDAFTNCAINLRRYMRDQAEINLLIKSRNWLTTLAVAESGSRDIAAYIKWCRTTKSKQQVIVLQRMIDHLLTNYAS